MVNKKHVIFSLLLPIILAIIIPIVLLFLLEQRSFMTLLTQNFIFLIFGLIILGFGLLLFIDCNWLFYNIGEGTLAPLPKIETKAMVIKGPYKYVRNPMIISVILVILAESFLFNSISILIYTGVFYLINAIYMPLSEEEGMIARFGEEYLHYKKNVRAWIPNLHPYRPLNDLPVVKITLKTSRPGLIIGKSGKRIQEIIDILSSVFGLENLQIEVEELTNSDINAQIMAERLAHSLERGRHYRRAGYYILRKIMESGLVSSVEVTISGKLNYPRAQKIIFKAGSISKNDIVAQEGVDKGVAQCKLETGMIGVNVRIQLEKAKKKAISKSKKKYKITEKLVDFIDDESEDKIKDAE